MSSIKRFVGALLVIAALACPANATINATAVWEVETGGATTNGAGYDAAISGAGTDYSKQAAAQISISDLACANTTTCTSASALFTSAMVGNAINIASGTNFTPGYYFIVTFNSSSSVVVDRNPTNGSSATVGVAKVGGAHSDPGLLCASVVAGNTIFIKNGTYSITSASTNVAGGCLQPPIGTATLQMQIIGYSSTRSAGNTDTRPLLQASGAITSFSILSCLANSNIRVDNISIDCVSKATSTAFNCSASGCNGQFYRCKCLNAVNTGFKLNTGCVCTLCECTGCSTTVPFAGGTFIACVADSNTIGGFNLNDSGTSCVNCVSCNNSGASSDGFTSGGSMGVQFINCTAYGNGRHGFLTTQNTIAQKTLINCIAENNGISSGTGYGFTASAQDGNTWLINCGGFNNQTGLVQNANIPTAQQIGLITATAEIFYAAGSNDFRLNTNPLGGNKFRAAGVPGSATAYQLPGISANSNSYVDCGAVQHRDPPRFFGANGEELDCAPDCCPEDDQVGPLGPYQGHIICGLGGMVSILALWGVKKLMASKAKE